MHDKSDILTIIDRFYKYTHFIPLGHPYTPSSGAHAFLIDIICLHDFPISIISNHDPIFTNNVWCDLFRLTGIKLHMSTTCHPI